MNLKTLLSRRHEDDLVDLLPSSERVAGSGSKRESHDVQAITSLGNEWWRFRYEAKCTQKKSYSLKLAEWRRLEEDVYSRSAQERPAWAVRFYDEEESVMQDLIVVDVNDWVELLEELETMRARQAKQV